MAAFHDDFGEGRLDTEIWTPHYLPMWSSREQSAANYEVAGSELRLTIPAEQGLWCPDANPESGGGGNCTHVRRCCLDASTSVPVGVSSRRPGRSIRGARRRRHTLLKCPPQIEGPTCGVSPLSEAGDPNAGNSGRLPQTTS